jgi:hypothetical protein
LTAEQTYGLILGLYDIMGYSILLFNYPLTKVFFDIDGPRYIATIYDEKIVFNTSELIQGVITDANWINRDPHTIVTKIVEIDELEQETLITFE